MTANRRTATPAGKAARAVRIAARKRSRRGGEAGQDRLDEGRRSRCQAATVRVRRNGEGADRRAAACPGKESVTGQLGFAKTGSATAAIGGVCERRSGVTAL